MHVSIRRPWLLVLERTARGQAYTLDNQSEHRMAGRCVDVELSLYYGDVFVVP